MEVELKETIQRCPLVSYQSAGDVSYAIFYRKED